jgi:hypothetical protein
MVMGTRSAPEFSYDVQRQLWDIRREHATLTGFKFKEGLEERLIASLSVEEATAEVAEAEAELEAWKRASEKRKTKGKKTAPPSSDKPDTGTGDGTSQGDSGGNEKDPNGGQPDPETEPKGDGKSSAKLTGEPSKPADGSDPSDSSSSDFSDPEGDERRKTSQADRARIRGRTPRVDTGGHVMGKKLYQSNPPAKYSGERDKDRTYEAVQLFLSQLSRYF